MNPRPLGYEPTDVRLRCLGQSPVTALTSADLRREVVPGLLHLSRLSLSRCVRFTNRFTEPVLDLWLSGLPRARTRALRPVGSSRHHLGAGEDDARGALVFDAEDLLCWLPGRPQVRFVPICPQSGWQIQSTSCGPPGRLLESLASAAA